MRGCMYKRVCVGECVCVGACVSGCTCVCTCVRMCVLVYKTHTRGLKLLMNNKTSENQRRLCLQLFSRENEVL